MKITHRWVARSLGDGQPVAMRRAWFESQEEQIGFLRQLVAAYRGTNTVTELAREIVFRWANCRPKDKRCHAVSVGRWVQANITYVNEGDERFQTPLATLRQGAGDCDDLTTLIASLVESLGIPCQLVALAWSDPLPVAGQRVSGAWSKVFAGATYRHIFARAVVGRQIVPLDATLDQPVEYLTDPVALVRARGVRQLRTLVL